MATGVAKYASERGNWSIVVAHDQPEFYVVLGDDDYGKLDGIVAGYAWERLPQIDCPVVYAHTPDRPNTAPTVCADNTEIGRLAAAHLMSLGLPYVAFVGIETNAFSYERQHGFERELKIHCRQAQLPLLFSNWHEMMHGTRKLKSWLSTLLLPCAVFCADDRIASVVVSAARQSNIQVPERLAILGVNDDDLACASTVPALSSIRINGDLIGYEAARQLDRSMSGESPNRRVVVRIPPKEVVQRGSTRVMGFDDLTVCEAMRLIQARAIREPVVVDQIAAQLGVHRQQLNRSFVECVGHSPKNEIDRVRGDRLRALLLSSAMPIKQIAYEMGFGSPSQLIRFCRRMYSKTPLELREGA
ncbi:MAG TPA: substrate-binding domain-containing protein [Tepidisphaeraceae bacterium]|jgi:LacI family transcriptional regulator|nr:substrate-binding domain-containing protein [Tepidisphaeraceae bacterium]